MDKRASNAALDAALCVTKDACGCAAEEVRNNAWEDQSNCCNLRVNNTKDKQAQDATDEGAQEADNNGVWSIGECDWAVDCWLCTRDKLLSNALECRNNLANDQTDTGQNDVNTTSEGEAAGKCPDNPVSGGLGTNVEQVAEVLETSILWVRSKLCSGSSCRYQG